MDAASEIAMVWLDLNRSRISNRPCCQARESGPGEVPSSVFVAQPGQEPFAKSGCVGRSPQVDWTLDDWIRMRVDFDHRDDTVGPQNSQTKILVTGVTELFHVGESDPVEIQLAEEAVSEVGDPGTQTMATRRGTLVDVASLAEGPKEMVDRAGIELQALGDLRQAKAAVEPFETLQHVYRPLK